jgi:hypothetical protein
VRRVALGRTALTLESLKLARSHFDALRPVAIEGVGELPAKLIVPRGTMALAARLLHHTYGDLSLGIQLEFHDASMSWALVGTTLAVFAEHPWTPHHQQVSK